MLDLSDDQIALLSAMSRPVITNVSNGVVWVGSRPHRLKDLFTLRTAGLVRSADMVRLHASCRFELTDRGIAEAQHRSSCDPAPPSDADTRGNPTSPGVGPCTTP